MNAVLCLRPCNTRNYIAEITGPRTTKAALLTLTMKQPVKLQSKRQGCEKNIAAWGHNVTKHGSDGTRRFRTPFSDLSLFQ